jgi:hypothetical protein
MKKKKNKILKHSKSKSREDGIKQGQYDGRFRTKVQTLKKHKREKYKYDKGSNY